MLVCLHFCDKDGALALEDLRWAQELDGAVPYELLLSYEQGTKPELVAQCQEVARQVFGKVHLFPYPAPSVKGWPAAPNWAFQNTARYVAARFKDYWFWWEADAIPLKSGWLKALDEEYQRGKKPLMGHLVRGVVPGDHINGCAMYPNNVASISVAALMCEKTAWDVVMAKDTQHCRHDASHLIDHVWGIVDGERKHAAGEAPVFRELQDVHRWVNMECVLFHRCKDDSLIQQLRRLRSTDYNVPQLCPRTEEARTDKVAAEVVAPSAYPATEIFIVSYSKDIAWLEYCLKSIRKYCRGFRGTTLVVPEKELGLFKRFRDVPVSVKTFDELPGKGHLGHMAMECTAEQLCPPGTEYVLHVDSDCVFHTPTTPGDYFKDGKPIYIVRTYESLYDPVRKVNSDCAQWKAVAEATLGFAVTYYTMCRHPTINWVGVFPEFRKWVESTHGKPFLEYVYAQRNAFPPTFTEYPALGAFAYEFFHEKYHWIDSGKEAAPPDRLKQFWSHGGITPQIKDQVEVWLK